MITRSSTFLVSPLAKLTKKLNKAPALSNKYIVALIINYSVSGSGFFLYFVSCRQLFLFRRQADSKIIGKNIPKKRNFFAKILDKIYILCYISSRKRKKGLKCLKRKEITKSFRSTK